MTKDELEERRERARYDGRTKAEVRKDLRMINDSIFGMGGSADVEELLAFIETDKGFLTYLDDLALSKMPKEQRPLMPELFEPERIARVREMILKKGKIPDEAYQRGKDDETYFTGDIPAF